MKKWDGLNRRKFPRIKYPCMIVLHDGSSEEPILTHTVNVGIGGVCIVAKKDIKMFSKVDIELDLLDFSEHIRCSGKVVWNVKRGPDAESKPLFHDMGIEFEDLSETNKKRLLEIIETLVDKEGMLDE